MKKSKSLFTPPTKRQLEMALGDLSTAPLEFRKAVPVLKNHFKKLGKAKRNDWLYSIKEVGQSFKRYTRSPINKVSQR